MECKFILIADAVNISREGKLNIAGEFNAIFASQTPAGWPSMSIVARLEANAGEGVQHAAQFRITDEDGAKVFETPVLPIRFGRPNLPGAPIRADAVMNLAGLVLPRYGLYSVHVLVDGVARGMTTLTVVKPPTAPDNQPKGPDGGLKKGD